MERTYQVNGMTCGHCASVVEKVCMEAGAENAHVDLQKKCVYVSGGEDAAIKNAIEKAGYSVEE